MRKLKPCPFCGSDMIQKISKTTFRMGEKTQRLYGSEQWYIICSYCDTRTGYYISEQDAENAWNRRA